MNFNELENGMAIKTGNDKYGMVYKGFMDRTYVMFDGKSTYITELSNSTTPLSAHNITEVSDIRRFSNGDFLTSAKTMFRSGKLVWKYQPVVEMTLSEICEILDKNIKIVKE